LDDPIWQTGDLFVKNIDPEDDPELYNAIIHGDNGIKKRINKRHHVKHRRGQTRLDIEKLKDEEHIKNVKRCREYREQLKTNFEMASSGGKMSFEDFVGKMACQLPAVSLSCDQLRTLFEKNKDKQGFIDWKSFSDMAEKEVGIVESFVPMEARAQPIFDELKATFATGKTKSLAWRKQQLLAIKRMIQENHQELLDALRGDLGGGELRGLMEMNLMHDCDYMIENLDKWAADEHVPTSHGKWTDKDKWVVRKEPKGVVFIMGAWNYPIMLSLGPLGGAIAAGNCAIIKPSEIAGATSNIMASLLPRYLDKEAFHVVEGGVEETVELLKEKKVMPELPAKVDYVVAGYKLDMMGKAMAVARKLRLAGKTVDIYTKAAKKVGQAFNHADRIGAQRVAFVAPDEWEKGLVRIKDLRTENLSEEEKQREEWEASQPGGQPPPS